jgi:hypothetical protein
MRSDSRAPEPLETEFQAGCAPREILDEAGEVIGPGFGLEAGAP